MSVHDFVDQQHIPLTDEEMNKIKREYKQVDAATLSDIDDSEYEWQMVYRENNDEKYGRIMVSHRQKVYRGLTMGEFYGGGIVD